MRLSALQFLHCPEFRGFLVPHLLQPHSPGISRKGEGGEGEGGHPCSVEGMFEQISYFEVRGGGRGPYKGL